MHPLALAVAASNSTQPRNHNPSSTELHDVVWWITLGAVLVVCLAVALPAAYYPTRYVARVYSEGAPGPPAGKSAPDERPLLPGQQPRSRPASPVNQ